jgi:hypothetical protein
VPGAAVLPGFAVPAAVPVAVPEPSPDALDVPKPKRRKPEDDPFAAAGLRAGSFIFLPAVELETGYGDNLTQLPSNTRAGLFGRLTGDAVLRSDWSRHALEARFRGSLDSDLHGEAINGPAVDAGIKGRVDVTRTTTIDLAGTYLQGRNTWVASSSLLLPAGAVQRPETYQSTASAALSQAFGRLTVTASGLFGRYESDDVRLGGGGTLSGSDAAYDTEEGRLRASYEISPGFKPFADAFVNRRDYDFARDSSGILRGSDGTGAEGGVAFDLRTLTGEAAIGWQAQRPRDPLTPELSAMTARAALVWMPTALTVVRLKAATGLDETPFAATTLALTRSYGVELQQSLRVDLDALAKASFTKEDYAGTGREDRWARFGGGLVYKANRHLWLKGDYSYDHLDSSVPGSGYHAHVVTFGVRIQQ